ncbi:hypothetical protein [Luteibacter sp.]|jgi:hypothetical protein|uniref:hypothetical protein n=1 Tax=Luteibacter sp. TaxID=1886636 RepID=UPI002F3E4CBB
MNLLRSLTIVAVLAGAAILPHVVAQPASTVPAARDGQRDFDWEQGRWATKVRVLRNPLSGEAPQWVEYGGTSVIKPLSGGKANFVELSVTGDAGKIEGGSLRLYNPGSRQWSLNFASLRNGMLTAPVFGGFDGRGTGMFMGSDMLEGRAILVRFVITRVSPASARFEQAYSADGGATWETNWIATDTIETP